MWEWRRKKPVPEGFPEGFRVQRIGISAAKAIADLPGAEIAQHLREHPEIAGALLSESYDKRYSPSTYITEEGKGFRVGWLPRGSKGARCEQEFSNLADAATDYLLFSLGKGRWKVG